MYIPKVNQSQRPVYDTKTGSYVSSEDDTDLVIRDLLYTVNLLIDNLSFLETDVGMLRSKVIELELKTAKIVKENEQLKAREFTASRKLVRAAKCRSTKG